MITILIITIMIKGGKWLNPGQCVISATSFHDHWSQPWGGTQAADKVVVLDVVVLDNGPLDDGDNADKVADVDVHDNGPLDDGDEY